MTNEIKGFPTFNNQVDQYRLNPEDPKKAGVIRFHDSIANLLDRPKGPHPDAVLIVNYWKSKPNYESLNFRQLTDCSETYMGTTDGYNRCFNDLVARATEYSKEAPTPASPTAPTASLAPTPPTVALPPLPNPTQQNNDNTNLYNGLVIGGALAFAIGVGVTALLCRGRRSASVNPLNVQLQEVSVLPGYSEEDEKRAPGVLGQAVENNAPPVYCGSDRPVVTPSSSVAPQAADQVQQPSGKQID